MKKRGKSKVGRPCSLTEEVKTKLEVAFKIGASNAEACNIVGISLKTLYRYYEKHPDFREKMHLLQTTPMFEAKKNLYFDVHNGNVKTSLELLKLEESKKKRQEYAKRWRAEHFAEEDKTEEKTPSAFMSQFMKELNGEDIEDIDDPDT